MKRAGGVLVLGLVVLSVISTMLLILPSIVHPGEDCWDTAFRCDRTNLARINHDVPTLEQHGDLQNIAELWARSMALSGELQHNPDLGLQIPTGSGLYGENVGYGPDWTTVFAAFKNSPSHWSIILDRDFKRIGIGSQRDADGRLWIVLVFAAS